MRNILIIAGRELTAYFATPVATVFIVIFLVLQGALTFNLGGFFDRGQADLNAFFTFVPWVFLLLVPAITMRLWAEERRLGTIELLLTLPLTQFQAVIGKFLAAWAFCAVTSAVSAWLWRSASCVRRSISRSREALVSWSAANAEPQAASSSATANNPHR